MKRRLRARGAIAAICAGALLVGACVGTGVGTYDEFTSAVDGGADCAQLFEMRGNFDSAKDLDRIDADLDELGCEDAGSTRVDQ